MLEEHKRKKQEISHLINYTAEEGEKIVVRVRQTVSTSLLLLDEVRQISKLLILIKTIEIKMSELSKL